MHSVDVVCCLGYSILTFCCLCMRLCLFAGHGVNDMIERSVHVAMRPCV